MVSETRAGPYGGLSLARVPTACANGIATLSLPVTAPPHTARRTASPSPNAHHSCAITVWGGGMGSQRGALAPHQVSPICLSTIATTYQVSLHFLLTRRQKELFLSCLCLWPLFSFYVLFIKSTLHFVFICLLTFKKGVIKQANSLERIPDVHSVPAVCPGHLLRIHIKVYL